MPGLELRSIVTSSHASEARSAHPGAEILASAEDLFAAAADHDLVVVAAPNRHHASLALDAIGSGLSIVVDKPLAASIEDGERIAVAARAAGVVASVFHNRRWDGDFLTLQGLVADGSLGELHRLESRFERWRPEVDAERWREAGDPADAGGVLFDLGPHLIDQALELLGPAASVYAEVRTLRAGAQVDDDFFLVLEHSSGARSHLAATMMAAQLGPRFRALGSKAAYVKWGLDVQEDALREGASPGDPGFGEEPREAWGRVGTDDSWEPVPTERGRYVEFYEELERAVRAAPAGAPSTDVPVPGTEQTGSERIASSPPVPLEAGVETLRIIEAARRSSEESAVVSL